MENYQIKQEILELLSNRKSNFLDGRNVKEELKLDKDLDIVVAILHEMEYDGYIRSAGNSEHHFAISPEGSKLLLEDSGYIALHKRETKDHREQITESVKREKRQKRSDKRDITRTWVTIAALVISIIALYFSLRS